MRKCKNELYKTLADLIEKINEQEKLLDFLCKHEKDEIDTDWKFTSSGFADYFVIFLHEGKLERAKIFNGSYLSSNFFEVVNNTKDYLVICVKIVSLGNETKRYFKIDKSNCNVMEITEYFNEDENNGR